MHTKEADYVGKCMSLHTTPNSILSPESDDTTVYHYFFLLCLQKRSLRFQRPPESNGDVYVVQFIFFPTSRNVQGVSRPAVLDSRLPSKRNAAGHTPSAGIRGPGGVATI